jgi:hypothetical protein
VAPLSAHLPLLRLPACWSTSNKVPIFPGTPQDFMPADGCPSKAPPRKWLLLLLLQGLVAGAAQGCCSMVALAIIRCLVIHHVDCEQA